VVQIEWEDDHRSTYPLGFLVDRTSREKEVTRRGIDRWLPFDRDIESPPHVNYKTLREAGVKELLAKIRQFGFCFIPGCPATPEATKDLLEQMGPIRNTHYGGFYDFTSNMASNDTAYTDLALDAHTDTTYFSDPVGLQAFHILSHTGGDGGRSLLVDGFAAAKALLNEDSQAYDVLSTVGVYWHASGNEDVSIQPHTAFPVLGHDPIVGDLVQIRWNNSDRAGLATPMSSVNEWYQAAAKFHAILTSLKNQYWTQLQPGTPLIFDNWRVLHGRSKFTGARRMCGGYISRDDYISKLRLKTYGRERTLATTVTG